MKNFNLKKFLSVTLSAALCVSVLVSPSAYASSESTGQQEETTGQAAHALPRISLDETEPNDTAETAFDIGGRLERFYGGAVGTIYDLDDVDWYKFSVADACTLDLQFSIPNVSQENSDEWLQDFRIEVYQIYTTNLGDEVENIQSVKPTSSVYIDRESTVKIKVSPKNVVTNRKYRFIVQVKPDQQSWYDFAKQTVPVDQTVAEGTASVNGFFMEKKEMQFYKMKFDQAASVSCKLSNIPMGCNYDMEIYNLSSGEVVSNIKSGTLSEPVSFEAAPHDKYAIKVYPAADGYTGDNNFDVEANYKVTVTWENQVDDINLTYADSKYTLDWNIAFDGDQYEIAVNDQTFETTKNSYVFHPNGNTEPKEYTIKVRAKNTVLNTYSDWVQTNVKLVQYGDVNMDGEIDSRDGLLVQKYVAQLITLTEEQKILADVDGNGRITAGDSASILQYEVGEISEFPVGVIAVIPTEQVGTLSTPEFAFYGNVDGNKRIDAEDAVIIMKYVAETVTLTDRQKVLADVNGDGSINSGDSTLVMQYDVGSISEFPAGNTAVFI